MAWSSYVWACSPLRSDVGISTRTCPGAEPSPPRARWQGISYLPLAVHSFTARTFPDNSAGWLKFKKLFPDSCPSLNRDDPSVGSLLGRSSCQ